MARQRFVLAVDLGTSGCKCALTTLAGEVVAWAFRPVALHVEGVAAEQEPDDWWRALLGAAAELFARMPDARGDVAAICSSTQGEGTVAVGRDGRAIGRALTWLDMRGGASIARRVGGPVRVAGYGPLALLRWLRLTGGAPASRARIRPATSPTFAIANPSAMRGPSSSSTFSTISTCASPVASPPLAIRS